jgi:hypothetical protein
VHSVSQPQGGGVAPQQSQLLACLLGTPAIHREVLAEVAGG